MIRLILLLITIPVFGSTPDRITIKNNAGSITTIADIGRDIAASATEDLDLRNAPDFAASVDIGTLIDADTIDILLNTIVLSNDDAKELLRSFRIMKVSESNTVKTRDVTQIDFIGNVGVTDQGNGKVEVNVDGSLNPIGKLMGFTFFKNGDASNVWLRFNSSSSASNEVPFIAPYAVKLVSATWVNERDGQDTDVEFYKNGVLALTWQVRNKRSAYDSTLTFNVAAGDRVSVYMRKVGEEADDDDDDDDEPSSPVIQTLFQITDSAASSGGQATGD